MYLCILNRISKYCLYLVEDFISLFWKVYYRLMVIIGKFDFIVIFFGKKLFYIWYFCLLFDFFEIFVWYDVVEFFFFVENVFIMMSLRKIMKGVRNVFVYCMKF